MSYRGRHRQGGRDARDLRLRSRELRPATHLDPHLIEYADCARYLLNTVFRKWTTYHARPTDLVPLKADRLRAYFNPDYRMFPLVRDSLVARGVLECDYRYEVGGKCYGYRLAEPFRTRHVRVKRV